MREKIICSPWIKMVSPRPMYESHMEVISILYKEDSFKFSSLSFCSPFPEFHGDVGPPKLVHSQFSLSFFSYFSFFSYCAFWGIYLVFIILLISLYPTFISKNFLSPYIPLRLYRISSLFSEDFIFLNLFSCYTVLTSPEVFGFRSVLY